MVHGEPRAPAPAGHTARAGLCHTVTVGSTSSGRDPGHRTGPAGPGPGPVKPAQQWFQERPPPYSWEQEALDRVRRLMPAVEPHRAWATFSSTAQSGRVNECDLLVAVPAGLFLLESKSHPGKLRNTGFTWNFHGKDRIRTIHNPLHFNDVKTKELRSQPQWAARRLYKDDRVAVPHIEPAVFLSAPGLASHLDEVQRLRVLRRLPLPQPPAFRTASGHHYRSAQLAAGNRLRISADHLAGLACGSSNARKTARVSGSTSPYRPSTGRTEASSTYRRSVSFPIQGPGPTATRC